MRMLWGSAQPGKTLAQVCLTTVQHISKDVWPTRPLLFCPDDALHISSEPVDKICRILYRILNRSVDFPGMPRLPRNADRPVLVSSWIVLGSQLVLGWFLVSSWGYARRGVVTEKHALKRKSRTEEYPQDKVRVQEGKLAGLPTSFSFFVLLLAHFDLSIFVS